MSRVRTFSNAQALFVGPSPSSGYHFLTSGGTPTGLTALPVVNSGLALPSGAFNSIKQINGLTSLSYDITTDRKDIKELGRKSNVDRAHVNHPSINLDFSYYGLDLRNEIRLGFNVNFPTGTNKTPYFSKNFEVPVFSGFTSRSTGAAYLNRSAWPYNDRDRRNFFVSIAPEGVDAVNNPNFLNSHLIGFGDCHIKSYSVAFAVGDFITQDVSYTSENIVFYLSGSGQIPAANPKDLEQINNNIFAVPQYKGQIVGKSVLKATDVSFDIISTGYGSTSSDIKDLGFNASDIKVQSASISVEFERQELKGLGYRASVDRIIINPILVNLSVEALVGEDQEGKLRNLLVKDYDYNVTLKIASPTDYCKDAAPNDIVVRYDFLKAKFNSIKYSNTVNEAKGVVIDFTAEITDDVTGRGLYISGKVFETGNLFSGFNF